MKWTARHLLACIGVIVLGLAYFAAFAAEEQHPTSELREIFRPSGIMREQVIQRVDELNRIVSQEGACKVAAELGHFFWWINEEERKEIDDDLVGRLVSLFDRADSVESHESGKCVASEIASILGVVGARAGVGLPRLKKALHSAELEASKEQEAAYVPLLDESSYDCVLRRAIANIERE